MKRDSLRLPALFVTASIIALIVFAYTSSSKKLFMKQAFFAVQQSAFEKKSEIETSIEYAMSSIQLVSNFVSSRMTTRELKNPTEVLHSFSGKTPFDFIEYIRWDGMNMMDSSKGQKPFDASERVYYKNGIQGISGIWINYAPKMANDVLLNFYTPIYYENEIVGVLTGAMGGQSKLKELLVAAFFGQKIVGFLCDDNYRVISSTREDILPGMNIAEFSYNNLIADIIRHSEESDDFPFEFKEEGKIGFSCVSKVKTTNWTLVLIVLPKALNASMKEITSRMIFISVFIIIILLSFLSFQIYLNKRSSWQKEQTHINIINALSAVYQNLYVVNLDTAKMSIYQMSERVKSKYSEIFASGDYESNIQFYTEHEVYEGDQILFHTISTISKVRKIFETHTEYSFIYKVLRNGQMHYYQCCLLKPADSKNEFVAAFKDVNQLMEQQAASEKRFQTLLAMQETQFQIMSSISGIYQTVHMIDLKKDSVLEINTSKEVREIVNRNDEAAKQMTAVMTAAVYPENLPKALEFTNLSTVAARLNGKKIISEEFYGPFSGWFRASFITVETDEADIPYKVIFATQVIDEQKKKEESLINTANRDELTNLLNRHAYEDELKAIRETGLSDDFVYISMDVNGLKSVNDSQGHEAGDELIVSAATCMNEVFGKLGKVYRTGGDEFQALINAGKDELADIQVRFKKVIDGWKGKLIKNLSVSCGYVARAENPRLTIDDIARLADERMYKDKALYYSSSGVDRRAQQAAFNTLCKRYTKILKVNLSKNSFSVVKISDDTPDSIENFSDNFFGWVNDFAESDRIFDEDRKAYIEKMNFQFLSRYLDEGNSIFTIKYRRKINDEFKDVILEIIPAEDYSKEERNVFLYLKPVEFFEKGAITS